MIAFLAMIASTGSCFADDASDFFETRIRPVLAQQCFKCHGGENESGELRVDSRQALLDGGDLGPALKPGDPEASLIVTAMSYHDDDLQMPPDEQLEESVVADFRHWIKAGAVWPESVANGFESRRHWAFEPPQRPAIPAVAGDWIHSPVDAFIQARLQQDGLSPSPVADRRVLIRRLYLDLTGLPPSYSDIERWSNRTGPDAVRQLIDELLASPAYGERWARHWLDVSRYSDTKGYVFQEEREFPFAYTYRDWVIQAFNEDRPYDDFLVQQIAADLIEDESQRDLEAMGFLTLGRRFLNNRHDIINDRIDVVTRGTMGLTVTCARCHDHKYDPIPTADYYSLYGVFASSRLPKELPRAMVLVESGKPYNPRIFERGNARSPGQPVPRQFLEVLAGPDRKPFENGSGRYELATSIASASNPLTARVLANRIWMHHFRTPLVGTPSDFGLRSDSPEHPELLDYLACELMDSGWSIKHLQRLILNSHTWQQSSRSRSGPAQIDIENRFFWRMNRRRLEFESMRDSLLAASGELRHEMFGPSVKITSSAGTRRRSIYGFIDRQNLPAVFRTFDFASPDTHTPTRFETSVPQQTLYLRNASFPMTLAEQLTTTLRGSSSTPDQFVRELYRSVYSRDPSPDEAELCLRFVSPENSEAIQTTPRWQYGYGSFKPGSREGVQFQLMPHWTGKSWQGGEKLPDPAIGWASLSATHGHPGDAKHCAILRFHVEHSGQLSISGRLQHESDQGDGIRLTAVLNDREPLGQWTAAGSSANTALGPLTVTEGSTIDFIIDCRDSTSFDSFSWKPTLRVTKEGFIRRYNPVSEFHGPLETPIDRWTQLAHALLISNEFMFVD